MELTKLVVSLFETFKASLCQQEVIRLILDLLEMKIVVSINVHLKEKNQNISSIWAISYTPNTSQYSQTYLLQVFHLH